MSEKAVVHYKGPVRFSENRARLWPVDHTSPYVSNQTEAITSPVVSYNDVTGRLETANTVYIPVLKDNHA